MQTSVFLLAEARTVGTPIATERAKVRFPFECREPDSERLRYNVDILKSYCASCEGLARFGRCLRTRPSIIRAHLRGGEVNRGLARICIRCGSEFELATPSSPRQECDDCRDEFLELAKRRHKRRAGRRLWSKEPPRQIASNRVGVKK